MRTENISQQSSPFRATVKRKFVKDAERYYFSRDLSLQYDKFRKKLEQIEYMGDKKSVIMHAYIQDGKENKHLLYLKNTELNPKQAYILKIANKYTEILNYFSSVLNQNIIEFAENSLKH